MAVHVLFSISYVYTYNIHLLPSLGANLRRYAKHPARFIAACFCSDTNLVKSVVNYGNLARCHSVVGGNVVFFTRAIPGRLINLFLVNYCCVMLTLWLAIYQQLLVMKLGLHTLQWNCCAYVNPRGNLVTTVPTACLF